MRNNYYDDGGPSRLRAKETHNYALWENILCKFESPDTFMDA